MAKPTTSTPQPGSTPKSTAARPKPAGAKPAGDLAARRARTPSLVTFFQEARSELRKVTWPTRQEATNLTIAVVGMTVAIAIFLGIADQILSFIITPLLGGK